MNKQKNLENEADEIILTVNEIIEFKDGVHSGEINNVIYRKSDEYEYLDIIINTEDVNGNFNDIKTGVPMNLSIKSQLGKLLIACEFDFEPNQKISLSDIKEQFIGKNITFQTYTDKTPKGDFAKVMNETIKFK